MKDTSTCCLNFYTNIDLSKQGYQKQKSKQQKNKKKTNQPPNTFYNEMTEKKDCHRERLSIITVKGAQQLSPEFTTVL